MLAMHPEHQEAVFQKLYRLMPTKDMDLTQIELDQLPFTDMCIRETLRLFPTGSVIARVARKPIRLNNCLIPANVPLVVGIRQIQMQPMYYGANANLFDPYRIKEETIKNLPHAAFIPFSYGPRNCVGQYLRKMAFFADEHPNILCAEFPLGRFSRCYRLSLWEDDSEVYNRSFDT